MLQNRQTRKWLIDRGNDCYEPNLNCICTVNNTLFQLYRGSSVGSLKSVFSAGDVLISGAVNNRGYYLSFHTRLKMAYECCLSVAHLHSKGLMHCDIKSLNFLVTSDLSIRLADLGEARAYGGLRNSEAQGLPR